MHRPLFLHLEGIQVDLFFPLPLAFNICLPFRHIDGKTRALQNLIKQHDISIHLRLNQGPYRSHKKEQTTATTTTTTAATTTTTTTTTTTLTTTTYRQAAARLKEYLDKVTIEIVDSK